MERREVRLTKKSLREGIVAAIIGIVLGIVGISFRINWIVKATLSIFLIGTGAYVLFNAKKTSKQVCYIFDTKGLHVASMKGKYATIHWDNVDLDSSTLIQVNGRLHLSIALKEESRLVEQISRLENNIYKFSKPCMGIGPNTLPIQGYDIEESEFARLIVLGVELYGNQ